MEWCLLARPNRLLSWSVPVCFLSWQLPGLHGQGGGETSRDT